MTPRIFITYGTSYGQTARIAGRLEELLRARGCEVTLRMGDELPAGMDLSGFDGVLVGASLVMQGYQKYVREFVRTHASALNAVPSAFFAVSGSAGSKNLVERVEAARLAADFCADHGWRPALIGSFAGAIAYTKYNFVLRWVMKRISRKEGASTDTSRDHEYTDWPQVEAFAAEFAGQVLAEAAEPEPRGAAV